MDPYAQQGAFPRTSAWQWASQVRLYATMLLCISLLNALTALMGLGSWADLIVGGIGIVAGLVGIHAANSGKPGAARSYLTLTLCLTLTGVTFSIMTIVYYDMNSEELCADAKKENPSNDIDCDEYRRGLINYGLLVLMFHLACCGSCVYCANGYDRALRQEQVISWDVSRRQPITTTQYPQFFHPNQQLLLMRPDGQLVPMQMQQTQNSAPIPMFATLPDGSGAVVHRIPDSNGTNINNGNCSKPSKPAAASKKKS